MTNSRFQIHEGPPPPGFIKVFDEPVYYCNEYRDIQEYPTVRSIYLLDFEEKLIVGKVLFAVDESGTATSLSRAPFGSFCHADELDQEVLHWWITSVLTEGMSIRHPATFYNGFCSLQGTWKGQRTEELNHHIDLSDYHLGKLHNMQMRRIRKCRNTGFDLVEVKGEEDLLNTYEFIEKCREAQGLIINISAAKFIKSFSLLPSHYRAFKIINPQGETAAATIVIKVQEKIAYNYLPASSKAYHSYSPMAFLLFRVALLYKLEGYQVLDLGITSIDGAEQASLARFKERMGAIRSPKFTYQF